MKKPVEMTTAELCDEVVTLRRQRDALLATMRWAAKNPDTPLYVIATLRASIAECEKETT